MSTSKRITLQQAAEIIKDGSRITFSGFTIWRRPMALGSFWRPACRHCLRSARTGRALC